MALLDLPDSVVIRILGYLMDVKAVWNGPRSACRKLRELCSDPGVWKIAKVSTTTEEQCTMVSNMLVPQLSQARNLEIGGCIWGSSSTGRKLDVLTRGIKSYAHSLRILTINNTTRIDDVTIFDFPPTLEHLHLDCNIPDYFFEPFTHEESQDHFIAMKCIRLQTTGDGDVDKLLNDFSAFPGTLTSLCIDGYTSSQAVCIDNLLQIMGKPLLHLGLKYYSSNSPAATVVAADLGRMISENCPQLISLTINATSPPNTISFDDGFMRNLATDRPNDPYCLRKSLQHLTLGSNSPIKFDPRLPELENMKQLETLDICYKDGISIPKGIRPLLRFYMPKLTLRFYEAMKNITTYPERDSGLMERV